MSFFPEQHDCVAQTPVGSLWQHQKTKDFYRVTGHAMIESTWKPGVLYVQNIRSPSPTIIRDGDEFIDGRFLRVG